MPYVPINFARKLSKFSEHWSPSRRMFVVPKGLEHKPVADRECRIMVVEPAGTLNTGDVRGERTAPDGVWI